MPQSLWNEGDLRTSVAETDNGAESTYDLASPSERGKKTESSGYWCVLALQIALPAPDVHRTTRLVVPLLHIGWEA